MKKAIVVVRRADDWHASIEGESARWGCGRTPRAAIGDLLEAHADVFGVTIEVRGHMDDEVKPRNAARG